MDEFSRRRERTRRLPQGDVSDALADMLIGVLDVAAQLEAQVRSYDLPAALRDEALSVCRQIAAVGSRHALDLLDVRERLLRRGVALGKAEAA